MPCYDYRCDSNARDREYEIELEKKVHKLTDLLCTACQELNGYNYAFGNSELSRWWLKHQKEDEKRLRLEAERKRYDNIKAAALAKLSDEEKRILGVK